MSTSPAADPLAPVLVVCVVFNPGPELEAFGTSLATATDRPVDLVIVNNGDPSERADAVAAMHGGVVLDGGGNVGYGAAANVGLRTSSSPWAVVANPDLVWSPGSLDALVAVGDLHPEAGSLGPTLLNVDGTVYPSARAVPSLRQGLGHAVLGRVWRGNPWTVGYKQAQEDSSLTARPAGWLSGACLLLRRDALSDVGGFDETFFMFFEDLDLGERLRDAGWINLYVPEVRITHVQGVSWKAKPERMIRAHHTSARTYLHRRYHQWYLWPLRAAISGGLAVRERHEVRQSRSAATPPA
ncbi:glycosyltransferase family 2 protein [Sanguibacter antarcticus]|uniref:N-acetylglucosaminyl-diphospho-decaprenol L-rhamnosyltransferase n=1 Tax=Sanguibacter antarcticus TaxID=372484 RepID=A0A2A9E2V9_9MICO|nr:glycosyltransferase family 2 protein [Sanguibacter antarcticus]PFG32539.1 N-acetylglucosaminyl-diphospho-decaprenol L-rhamnosyltransferase [Sanguibacter antarcticus]